MIREGRPEVALTTIDAAEHAASTEAASAMPRICLQRSRALLALGRFAEAEELVDDRHLRGARDRSCPTTRRSCSACSAASERHAG